MQIAAAIDRPVSGEFEQAVGELYPALVRRLTVVVGDPEEARDLAQAAYLHAYQGWSRFDGRDARAWLYTIALRLAFRERRRRGRLLAFVRAAPTAEEPWQAPHDPALWEALRDLRRQERAALLLNVLDGYTQAEIGRLLGAPEGTVASWISRAKAQLRERLGSE